MSVNKSKKGVRVTAGLPGTGLSTSHLIKGEPANEQEHGRALEETLANADQTIADLDVLLSECRFGGWLENHLDPDSYAADPMYGRAVIATLTGKHLSAAFVARHLNVGIARGMKLVELMEADGIVPEETGSITPKSPLDIVALRESFVRYEAESGEWQSAH
jgi:DNA segregation ATPase FtsK/SpoIIIE-like protein